MRYTYSLLFMSIAVLLAAQPARPRPAYASVPGDANCDISAVIAIIYGATQTCSAADANGDDAVTVADVTAIELLLNPSPTPTQPANTPTPTASPTPVLTATPTLTPLPGPQITFFGVTTADNHVLQPIGTDAQGIPIYVRPFGAGFFIVVEGKPRSNPISTKTINYLPTDPSARPDIQIEANRDLGNGRALVCDAGPLPNPFGGVPGIDPPNFDPTSQTIADALNDFGCRFDAHDASAPCTLKSNDVPGFVAADTQQQFCTARVLGSELQFPQGDTLLTVQLRDTVGQLGNPAQLIVRVP